MCENNFCKYKRALMSQQETDVGLSTPGAGVWPVSAPGAPSASHGEESILGLPVVFHAPVSPS